MILELDIGAETIMHIINKKLYRQGYGTGNRLHPRPTTYLVRLRTALALAREPYGIATAV